MAYKRPSPHKDWRKRAKALYDRAEGEYREARRRQKDADATHSLMMENDRQKARADKSYWRSEEFYKAKAERDRVWEQYFEHQRNAERAGKNALIIKNMIKMYNRNLKPSLRNRSTIIAQGNTNG